MRNIVNISLPDELNKEVDRMVKSGNYASKSEFFRHILRLWKEDQLLKELNESRSQIAGKKGRVLKSLKDLR